jgi:hypothetical protein
VAALALAPTSHAAGTLNATFSKESNCAALSVAF